MEAIVVGAGLAGSEAAWQLARAGLKVTVYEMRPTVTTKAHKTDKCAELVCSNSFRGAALSNAVGLLKEELKLLGSLIMEAALVAKVPSGGALAVDRLVFSEYVDRAIRNHPLITFKTLEVPEVPEPKAGQAVIIASGPLTSRSLSESIARLTGEEHLAFFDAISPIVTYESLDLNLIFRQSRYDKGGDDYLNIPLDASEYEIFVRSVAESEKYGGNQDVENDSLDKLRPFEGCMPIEEMVERGPDTLRFGPLKPVGLTDPRTGRRPHAVIQLRQDDMEGRIWSLVGFQTRMKRHEQERILRSLPGLANCDIVRFGSVHRNSFINSPRCLTSTGAFRGKPGLFFAGQITGVEGYVESTAGGMVAGLNAARYLKNMAALEFPNSTAIGALMHYISDENRSDFQPMNISFGLMPGYFNEVEKSKKKKQSKVLRREQTSRTALSEITRLSELVSNL